MNIKEHYKELFKKHGDAPQSLQYSDKATQNKRFQILSEIDPNLESVVDLGCGLGDLYDYLRMSEHDIEYLGLDFVEEFISKAKEKHKDSKARFKVFDILSENIPDRYNYIMLSGVFNNKTENNWEFMQSTIGKMFSSSKKGISFNAMSTYVDYFDDGLFYIDPCQVFDFCKKELSRKVILRHDYLVKANSIPFEFAIYVYK